MKGHVFDSAKETDRIENSNSYELILSGSSDPEVCLSWSNISYTAKHTKILNNVSGYANPKEILAIMGSSGSGKTSLLSILSQQLFPSNEVSISGTIELNNTDIHSFKYQSYCGYIPQENILLPTLTPRESLTFSARLKVNSSPQLIAEKVETLLKKLHIFKVADNIIGNEYIKGLSGGEKKRLSIGLELIADPLIIILDEPTSGLDSYTAKMIVRLLKEEAVNGKTIVMTIHQPGQEIYENFDRLILMVTGHFVYQGLRKDALEYFDKIGFVCPHKTLPQDHFMRILYLQNARDLTDEEKSKISFFVEHYNTAGDQRMINQTPLPYSINDYRLGKVQTCLLLVSRCFVNTRRNPMLFKVKVIQAIILGTILSLIFKNLGYDYVQVKNRVGLLFYMTMNTIMVGCLSNATTFPAERPLFLKEYKEGRYGVIPYYFSKFLSELPTVIIFTLLYSLIVYFSVNFNRESPKHYFIFLGLLILMHISGMSLGNLAGVIAPSFALSSFVATTLATPFVLFGGFFSNTHTLTDAFEWIKYISPMSRGYEALILNEFDGLPIDEGLDPVRDLGFSGEIWQKVGALLLITGVVMILAISALKIRAVRAVYR